MMKKPLSQQQVIIIIACVLLLATAIYQKFINRLDVLEKLQQLEPEAVQFTQIAGEYPTYQLWDQNDIFLGYAVQGRASGYGGPISVLTSIKIDGTIANLIVIEHYETPAYFARVLKENYLDQFIGKSVSDRFELDDDLDAISGATYTVGGIAQAVHKGAAQVGLQELKMTAAADVKPLWGWPEAVLLLLYSMASIGVITQSRGIFQKYTKIRPLVLFGSFLFLGVMLNSALSLANFAGLISGNLPTFTERPFWYLLTFGIILLTLILRKNVYCFWLCPFGAIQVGIHKVLSFKKYTVPPALSAVLRKIRWGVIWLALMAALLLNNPSAAGFEPFTVAFGGSGNIGQWLILCVILLTSIVVYRGWCRFFCPVGAVLNILSTLGKKDSPVTKDEQTAKAPIHLESKDKFFVGLMAICVLLIVFTLYLNMVS